ncbi:MAG: hypothetical protein Q9213_006609 [Squamulea squamosa]
MTCSVSMEEARAAIDSLIPAVEAIRGSSQEVSRRLAALESQSTNQPLKDMSVHEEQHSTVSKGARGELHGMNTQDNINTSTDIATTAASSHIEVHTREISKQQASSKSANRPGTVTEGYPLPDDLELVLQCSRPYSRLQSSLQETLLSSSSTHTGLNSMVSGLSLSAVSNLSLISLPVSLHEIWNSSHYTAFSSPQYLPSSNETRTSGIPNQNNSPNQPGIQSESTSGASEKLGASGLGDHETVSLSRVDNLGSSLMDPHTAKPRRKLLLLGRFDTG